MAGIGLKIKITGVEVARDAVNKILTDYEFIDGVSEEYKKGFREFAHALLNAFDNMTEDAELHTGWKAAVMNHFERVE